MRFQETECSSPVDTDVGRSNANSVPLDDNELIYDVELLPHDPGKIINITDYPPNQRNSVRSAYILKTPCQPKSHTFPTRDLGGPPRFSVSWFGEWDWLEYSIEKDVAFCFVCYLFKNEDEANVGGDAFVNGGFRSWNKPDRFQMQRDGKKNQFMLLLGLAIRGHRENKESHNRGNFIELLKWLKAHNEDFSHVMFENAPGKVVERFLGLVHVGDTTALFLKKSIMSLLVEHSLSPSKIRGQGYDGARNMKVEINGLKTLIIAETPSTYYVHCFAHQLQLTLVAVGKNNNDCAWFFDTLATLLSVVGVSCKRREMVREIQAQKVAQALKMGEVETGSGLNQELGLKRPGETRWGSYYKNILNFINLFATIVEVLVKIGTNGSNSDDKAKVQGILYPLESFNIIFMAQLMSTIFGYTNDLCLSLQRKDQDIVSAMRLVSVTKGTLQSIGDLRWDTHRNKVISLCNKYEIVVPNMEAHYIPLKEGQSVLSSK